MPGRIALSRRGCCLELEDAEQSLLVQGKADDHHHSWPDELDSSSRQTPSSRVTESWVLTDGLDPVLPSPQTWRQAEIFSTHLAAPGILRGETCGKLAR